MKKYVSLVCIGLMLLMANPCARADAGTENLGWGNGVWMELDFYNGGMGGELWGWQYLSFNVYNYGLQLASVDVEYYYDISGGYMYVDANVNVNDSYSISYWADAVSDGNYANVSLWIADFPYYDLVNLDYFTPYSSHLTNSSNPLSFTEGEWGAGRISYLDFQAGAF